MALPANFNHWEHLQDMLRREHNRAVSRYFRDVGDIDWEPTVNTPRASLRTACTIDDKDTVDMTLLRLYLFYEILGYSKKGLARVYGIPATRFEENVVGKPEVFLYFSMDREAIPDGSDVIDAEYSFRLMDESSSSMTMTKAKTIANKIKSIFINNNQGIVWTKGKFISSYTDKELGYRLRIYASSKTEGIEVIKKILQIRSHSFDEEKYSLSSPDKNSINNPGTVTIMGKKRNKKRWRPTGNVRFRYAYLYVHGYDEDIPLVDTTGRWFNTLAD